MTLGEYRVGLDFNPSGNELVTKIKRMAADFIDLCHTSNYVAAPSEIKRLWALAMTDIETAAMHAVKAATKKPL